MSNHSGNLFRAYQRLVVVLAVSLFLVCGLFVVDFLLVGRLPHDEGPPVFDPYHLFRLAVAIAVSVLLVSSIPRSEAEIGGISERKFASILLALSAIVLWLVTAMVVFSPGLLVRFGAEDGLVENFSFACAMLASILFAVSYFLIPWTGSAERAARLLVAALAIVLFLIAMEEISWTQRILGLDTPAFFSGNAKGEINFHNYATNLFESAYYLAGFAVLCFMPFVINARAEQWPASFRAVAPTWPVAASGMAMTVCCWGMWDIIPIQMTFWISIALLARQAKGEIRSRGPVLFLLVSMIVCQVLIQINGHKMDRGFNLTEYREAFIAFGFLVYAVVVSRNVRRRQSA